MDTYGDAGTGAGGAPPEEAVSSQPSTAVLHSKPAAALPTREELEQQHGVATDDGRKPGRLGAPGTSEECAEKAESNRDATGAHSRARSGGVAKGSHGHPGEMRKGYANIESFYKLHAKKGGAWPRASGKGTKPSTQKRS